MVSHLNLLDLPHPLNFHGLGKKNKKSQPIKKYIYKQ